MKESLPVIAIVGQANVGKSSLFNRLVGFGQAIVAREAGTTRDSVSSKLSLPGGEAWLVDTAGIKNPEDEFEATIQEQIEEAIAAADLIMIVVESSAGIAQKDRDLAKLILRSGKSSVLIANKADQAGQKKIEDFRRTGIQDIFMTSTTTGQGIGDLIEFLSHNLPLAKPRPQEDQLRVAMVGRPNVGKSSLFNRLAAKQQAIVSERAGTTRDTTSVSLSYHGKPIEFIDTAGIRRNGKIETGIEKFSVLRTMRAIDASDVCLLLLDARELEVSLDQKLAGMIKQANKGLVIVINKWDLIEKDAQTADRIASEIAHIFDFVPWAPLIFTSTVSGQNVSKILDLVSQIREVRQQKISTPKLNSWLAEATRKHTPAGLKNSQPRIKYVTQAKDKSWPSFIFFGSDMALLHWSYKRYLEKQLRQEFDFTGTAIELIFNEKPGYDPHEKPKSKRKSK